ncbi:Zn-dependent hydrolase [Clostridium sp. HMP27]|uniref:Zn-dependent hydrolase n=1 Tax=Clostridium sp. HMP27 TaxID=1487921 RepID=UPI00052D7A00|nr:Zn-dependent hydrolase [Clostridium sp. HMP27]KGK86084.1 allantoate amidohydrolase [Clostridium sp. HMP27]
MNTNLERIKRDIEALGEFTSTPGAGNTRLSFSEEDRKAREYIKGQMKEAGLQVYEDAAGTIVGRLEGELKDAPVVMIGSHYDSVKNGGIFDGPAGVVTALESARVFKENNIKPKYPVEFIAMIEEEGCRFGGGLFASRAMAGKVTREELDKYKDTQGISIAQAMREFGFNPDEISKAVRDPKDIKAFLELHIEQGPILESNNKDLGIVQYVVGIREFEVIIKGRADHAGTTPMDMRLDALDAAASVISKISEFAKEAGEGTVATIGKFQLLPGAANIVPEEVKFTVDIRSKSQNLINEVSNKISKQLQNMAETKGVKYEITDKLNVNPVKLSENIISIMKSKADNIGFTTEDMLSGAGHDAMIMAGVTEVGLLFVPSKNGRSHCPEEWTDYDKLQKGVEIMCGTLEELCK